MRCCVPSCSNTSEHEPTAVGRGKHKAITFHGFPSEAYLSTAWLRALGKQDTQLPDEAVVCSQHFLSDDIYKTESGLREIDTGAIPSTVQVCMICLDTDSKLFLMSKHKLEQAYEKLTGYPTCDQGNLRQTLCAQCAQRLMNFSRFRNQTLKARSLMLDLVEKYKLITLQHIKSVKHTEYQLKCNLMATTLGPDHYDLHVEHPNEGSTTELEKTVVVKNEVCYDSMMVDDDMELLNEDGKQADNDNDALIVTLENEMDKNLYPLKCESATFGCTLCFEEFTHEHEYNEHVSIHVQNGVDEVICKTQSKPAASSSCDPSNSMEHKYAVQNLDDDSYTYAEFAHITAAGLSEHKDHKTKKLAAKEDTIKKRGLVHDIKDGEVYNKIDTSIKTNINIDRYTNSVVKLHDVKKLKKSPIHISSCDSRLEIPMIKSTSNTLQNVTTDRSNDNTFGQLDNSQGHSLLPRNQIQFICAVCNKTFKRKNLLSKHINNHNRVKRFNCKFCPYVSKFKHHADMHMQTHTGEKPYSCDLCEYKCARSNNLVRHMRTHNSRKISYCKLCDYKSDRHSDLALHMLTHCGKEPYSCNLCEYKTASSNSLVMHMRTHTGEKPYSCKLCDYKFSQNSHLHRHMLTHSGETPYSCNLCDYKCAYNSHLVRHMRTHAGDKNYFCNVCDYKCAKNSHLVLHMRTHTGEKPYSCEVCEYRFARNSHLRRHMITHSVETPYSCKWCDYKCAQKCYLVSHMRTHTGEKPYSCKLCKYKCAHNTALIKHVKKHSRDMIL